MGQQFKAIIEEFDAEDVRAFYDSEVFRVWHLAGKEHTFRIAGVQRITTTFRNEVKKTALLRLEYPNGREVQLPLSLNVTNRDTIRSLYGDKPREWVGHMITLYPTTAEVGGVTKDAIRIRNYDPELRRKNARVVRQNAPVQHPRLPDPRAKETLEAIPRSTKEAREQAGFDPFASKQPPVTDAEFDEEPPPGALETDRIKLELDLELEDNRAR